MSDRSGSTLGAFLFGAAVGVAVGLLTAPKSGRETREDLSRWADDARARARDRLDDLSDRAEHLREVAADAGERVREIASDAGDRVRRVVSKSRDRIQEEPTES